MITYPLPIEFDNYEVISMRLLLAYVIYKSFLPKEIKFKSQPNPNGIAKYINLTFLSNPNIYKKLKIIIFLLLVVYVIGIGLSVSTLLLFIFTVLIGTYYNSQGAISHSSQIISLVLLAQFLAYLNNLIGINSLIKFSFAEIGNPDDIAIFLSQQAVVAVYFTSALTKLLNSRFRWISQVRNIPIQLEKNAMQNYYNNLDYSHVDKIRNVANFLASKPFLTCFLFSIGLLLEFLLPLSLLNRFTNIIFGVLIILFHNLNLYIFRLKFASFQRLLLIFFVNVPFLVITMLGRII